MQDNKVPVLHDDAKIGLTGRVLEMFRGHVEPAEPTLLFTFLTTVGNIIGNDVYITAGGGRHPGRLFTVAVGKSSVGRKGTSWSHVRKLVQEVFPNYIQDNVLGGASSGEGIITSVEDRKVTEKENKKTGEKVEVVLREGVKDKKKLFVETEFSRVLRVMARETNPLSEILRQAWDTGDLRVLTKDSYYATGAHISLIGHITQRELESTLAEVDKENGFANRILWVVSTRKLVLPEDIPFDEKIRSTLVFDLNETLSSQMPRELTLSDEAKSLWSELYTDLTKDVPGLVGAILSRGAPQVLRMAVIYSCLSGERKTIEVSHLKAAYACWQYARESVENIFKNSTGNKIADDIYQLLEIEKRVTRTIINDFFYGKVLSPTIEQAIDLLVSLKMASREKSETAGRYIEYITLAEKGEKGEKAT